MSEERPVPPRTPPYGLRMPPDLKERVQKAAEASNRSMNAEIIARLEATFRDQRRLDATQQEEVALILAEMKADRAAFNKRLEMLAARAEETRRRLRELEREKGGEESSSD